VSTVFISGFCGGSGTTRLRGEVATPGSGPSVLLLVALDALSSFPLSFLLFSLPSVSLSAFYRLNAYFWMHRPSSGISGSFPLFRAQAYSPHPYSPAPHSYSPHNSHPYSPTSHSQPQAQNAYSQHPYSPHSFHPHNGHSASAHSAHAYYDTPSHSGFGHSPHSHPGPGSAFASRPHSVEQLELAYPQDESRLYESPQTQGQGQGPYDAQGRFVQPQARQYGMQQQKGAVETPLPQYAVTVEYSPVEMSQ
jgi:hypothetical protein